MGGSAASVMLVRSIVANKYRYAIQMVVRLPEAGHKQATPRKTLVAVHMGWASDEDNGRRIAGIADSADPSSGILLQMPVTIEESLERSSELQSERDKLRDTNVELLKSIKLADDAKDELKEELAALQKLVSRPQYIAIRRIYRLQRMLNETGSAPEWMRTWTREDRKLWQGSVGVARRARGQRRDFYRNEAHRLASTYSAIVIESLDLKAAAEKIDPSTGERSEFKKKARSGRTVAALYEFEQALKWSFAKAGGAAFDLAGSPTISTCSHCGEDAVKTSETDPRIVVCSACGAEAERRLAGAARAWQMAAPGIEEAIVDFHAAAADAAAAAASAKAEKMTKLSAGRRAAREAAVSAQEG